ncbi:MAG: DUF4197 family protein [Bacteroidetes bacterium]|nr:DUF4197 family protein [Bacteroidota bacterium]
MYYQLQVDSIKCRRHTNIAATRSTKIETTLRGLGMGAQVDRVIDKLNEGAENAVKTAKPIFVDAVK